MTQGEAIQGLKKLNYSFRSGTKHPQFRVECGCGVFLAQTRVSRRNASVQLGAMLESAMAKQLGIETKLWREIAGCQKGQKEYLTAHGHWHHS